VLFLEEGLGTVVGRTGVTLGQKGLKLQLQEGDSKREHGLEGGEGGMHGVGHV
jgi:hypothetical protein